MFYDAEVSDAIVATRLFFLRVCSYIFTVRCHHAVHACQISNQKRKNSMKRSFSIELLLTCFCVSANAAQKVEELRRFYSVY